MTNLSPEMVFALFFLVGFIGFCFGNIFQLCLNGN